MSRSVSSVLLTVLLAPIGVGCLEPQRATSAPNPGKADDAEVTDEVLEAARANLERVRDEIDPHHLDSYGLEGEVADQFLDALFVEYARRPDQLLARATALASMV